VDLATQYSESEQLLCKNSALNLMLKEEQRLDNATYGTVPFDPRYNATAWALDCLALVREIVYSYCWMEAYAASDEVQKEGNVFHLRYYADNCIVRIASFKDKAALVAWAYYCPFSPEQRREVLAFEHIMERLRCPVRFGLRIVGQKAFLRELQGLEVPCFKRAMDYRHRKIHRLEPKIVIRKPTDSDGWRYMYPLFRTDEIEKWRKRLEKTYPSKSLRSAVEENCRIRETLYDRRPTKDEYWYYRDVKRFTGECLKTCICVARGVSAILRRRAPLRGKR